MPPNTSYGINAALAQQLQQPVNPYLLGDDPNDPLAQALSLQARHKVYSPAQGIADVIGDVGGAYFKKKALKKAAETQQQNAELQNTGNAIAGNAAMARDLNSGAPVTANGQDVSPVITNPQQQPGMASPANPGMQYGQVSIPQDMANVQQLSPQQRTQAAVDAVASKNAALAAQLRPEFQKTAQGAMPQYQNVDGVGLVRMDPNGGPPTVAVAKGSAPHVVGRSLMNDKGEVVGTAPRDSLEEAKLKSEIEKNKSEAAAATAKNNVLAGIPEGVQGPEVYQYLSPLERSSVQAIVNGDQPLPSRTANPQGQRIAGLVSLADPTYSSQRVKVKQDFAAGPSAKNIKSIGTAIQHIQKWSDQMDELNNLGGVGTILNGPLNAIAEKTGNAPVVGANQAADAVAGEMENAFRGSGSSITGIHEWRKNVSTGMAPEQKNEARQTALDLLDGRMDALANQWNQVMPADQQRTGLDFLGPKQREIYAKLKGTDPGQAADTPAPEGVDATIWAHMKPEERALWKK